MCIVTFWELKQLSIAMLACLVFFSILFLSIARSQWAWEIGTHRLKVTNTGENGASKSYSGPPRIKLPGQELQVWNYLRNNHLTCVLLVELTCLCEVPMSLYQLQDGTQTFGFLNQVQVGMLSPIITKGNFDQNVYFKPLKIPPRLPWWSASALGNDSQITESRVKTDSIGFKSCRWPSLKGWARGRRDGYLARGPEFGSQFPQQMAYNHPKLQSGHMGDGADGGGVGGGLVSPSRLSRHCMNVVHTNAFK